MGRTHQRRDAPLVVGVRIAVQQDDRDGVDAGRRDLGGDAPDLGRIERFHLGAGRIEPTADLPDVLRRDRSRRLHPREQIGLARDVVPADLEDVAKAARDDQRDRCALALEDEIRGDRRSVQHPLHVRRSSAGNRESGGDALAEAARRIVGRRSRLRHRQPASRRVEQRDVGERTAGIDADQGARLCSVCGTSAHSRLSR